MVADTRTRTEANFTLGDGAHVWSTAYIRNWRCWTAYWPSSIRRKVDTLRIRLDVAAGDVRGAIVEFTAS